MIQSALELLEQSHPAGKWRSKLRKIGEAVRTYEQLPQGDQEQGERQYLHPILPIYWEVFHTHNQSRYFSINFYDVGIFLVGFSSIPIVLSIAGIQPRQKIYFLHSGSTDRIVIQIEDRIRAMLNTDPAFGSLIKLVKCADYVKIDNPSDPVATFKEIKGIINAVGNKRIALDLTGGKKPMLGGGFTAAAILRFADSIRSSACDMFYVDSSQYDERIGAPVPGTEFLTQLENPYDIYNVQSTLEAEKLFKEHNYKEAAELWGGIKDKLDPYYKRFKLSAEYNEAVNHYRRANCYHLWDALYYDLAKSSKNRHQNSWGYDQKHTRCSIDVLDILSAVHDRTTLFSDPAHIIHCAVDRYQNGIRRQESGKLEDAIVRFTQVIEILCVYKIYRQYPIVANRNGETQERDPDPNNDIWHIKPLIQFLFGQLTWEGDNAPTPPEGFNDNLPCNVYRQGRDFYWLNNSSLSIEDYSPFCTVDEITNLIEYRNEFIHVTSAMRRTQTEENARKLQKLALRFLANFSQDYRNTQSLSFRTLLKLHRFQKK